VALSTRSLTPVWKTLPARVHRCIEVRDAYRVHEHALGDYPRLQAAGGTSAAAPTTGEAAVVGPPSTLDRFLPL